MADKEIKITTLTEQQREVLKSKTPFILPDNPSQKGYSASQIKKTMYEPVLLLFDWLKRQGLETKEAFEYLNNYIFEKGNALSEDIENSKKYAKDLVDNLALTVDGNLTESKNYTDLEIDKVELDYNKKIANVTKDVTEKHQAVTKKLNEHDNDISVIEKQIAEISNIGKANLQIIESIDQVVEQNVIYLIKDETATGEDVYKEYILANGEAILIGSTSVDLRPYLPAEQIAEIYATKKGVTEEIDDKIGDIDSLLDKLNGTTTFEEDTNLLLVDVPESIVTQMLTSTEWIQLTDEEFAIFENYEKKRYRAIIEDTTLIYTPEYKMLQDGSNILYLGNPINWGMVNLDTKQISSTDNPSGSGSSEKKYLWTCEYKGIIGNGLLCCCFSFIINVNKEYISDSRSVSTIANLLNEKNITVSLLVSGGYYKNDTFLPITRVYVADSKDRFKVVYYANGTSVINSLIEISSLDYFTTVSVYEI